MFFKRFFNLEKRLDEFRVELDALKDVLNDVRAERDEFKQLLFQRVGLINEENRSIDSTKVAIQRTPVSRALKNLEVLSREKAWEEKAKKAEQLLNGDGDASKSSTDNVR